MKNAKNQNPILALATLGVYLGLVFVGATPQVLAQAAMTRQFNVNDKVDVKDEFDGNPDIEELKSFLTNALEGTIASFVSDVRESDKNSVGRAALQESYSLRTVRNFCAEDWVEVTDALKAVPRGNDPVTELHRSLDVGSRWEFVNVPRFIQAQEGPSKQKFCKTFWVSTSLDSNELSVKFLFSRPDSLAPFRLAGYLNKFLFDRAHLLHDPLTEQIYQRTRATSDYASVLVVTQFPRSGLDSLPVNVAR